MSHSTYKLMKSSAIYYLVEIFQKGLLLLITPLFASKLGFNDFGLVSAYIIIIAISTPIISLSMHGTVTRLFHEYVNEKERFTITTLTVLTVLMLVLFVPIYFLLFYVSSNNGGAAWFENFLLTGAIITQPYFTVSFAFFKVQQKVRNYVIMFSCYYTIQTFLILLFIVYFNYKAVGYLFAILATNVAVLMVLYLKFVRIDLSMFDLGIAKRILNYSFNIFPIDALGMLNTYIDRYFIMVFLGVGFVGVYFIAVQLSAAVLIAVIAINSVLAPLFYKQIAKEKNENCISNSNVTDIFNPTIMLTIKIVLSLVLALTIIGKIYIFYLYDESYSMSSEILPMVMLLAGTNVFFVLISNSANLDVVMIRVKMATVVLGVILTSVVNYKFIDIVGIWSVPIASLISIWFVILTLRSFIKRNELPILIQNKHIVIYFIFSIVFMSYFVFLDSYDYKSIVDAFILIVSVCYIFHSVLELKKVEKRRM